MSGRQPIGHTIDALGVRHTPADGELIDAAFVILHVVGPDGRTAVRTAWSEGVSWVTRRGLIEVARDSERIAPIDDEEDA